MMSFITDKQTTEELNLLNRYQPSSVYSLFNKVATRGGEQLLEEMLRHPLTNADAINERTAVFKYFQQHAYSFPLEKELVALISTWLDSGVNRTAVGAALSAIRKKTLSTLVHDERYGQQEAGIRATAQMLGKLKDFVSAMAIEDIASHPYHKNIGEIKNTLHDKRLASLLLLSKEGSPAQKLSIKETAYYDHLLKKTLEKEMEAVLKFIYEIDVYIAVSSVAKAKDFCYAIAKGNEGDAVNELVIKQLRHPALEKAVGNDLSLDAANNLLFLTGANMAGKSTLMKSVGIALYLAHAGFPVAAKEMVFSVKEGLYSSINVPDNINLGYSHFYAEVLRVRQAAELVSQGKSMLVMFDELFKGTNVKDAYEGTLEVTKAFSKYRNCLFIVSTHIIEVGEALSGQPNIRFGYMPTIMEGSRPHYPYKLTEGITEDRQGMLIVQNEGILELLA